jgi:hypothetical protein
MKARAFCREVLRHRFPAPIKNSKVLRRLRKNDVLQALQQKRRPQWYWETRPNFPAQLAQRFSNLVMRLPPIWRFAAAYLGTEVQIAG